LSHGSACSPSGAFDHETAAGVVVVPHAPIGVHGKDVGGSLHAHLDDEAEDTRGFVGRRLHAAPAEDVPGLRDVAWLDVRGRDLPPELDCAVGIAAGVDERAPRERRRIVVGRPRLDRDVSEKGVDYCRGHARSLRRREPATVRQVGTGLGCAA
jgi:hypothetical protein